MSDLDLTICRNYIDCMHDKSYTALDNVGKFELARELHLQGFLAGIDYALGRLDKREQAE